MLLGETRICSMTRYACAERRSLTVRTGLGSKCGAGFASLISAAPTHWPNRPSSSTRSCNTSDGGSPRLPALGALWTAATSNTTMDGTSIAHRQATTPEPLPDIVAVDLEATCSRWHSAGSLTAAAKELAMTSIDV